MGLDESVSKVEELTRDKCDQIFVAISDGNMDPRFLLPLFCRKGWFDPVIFDPRTKKEAAVLLINERLQNAIFNGALEYHEIARVVMAWKKNIDPLDVDTVSSNRDLRHMRDLCGAEFLDTPSELRTKIRCRLGIPDDYFFPFGDSEDKK